MFTKLILFSLVSTAFSKPLTDSQKINKAKLILFNDNVTNLVLNGSTYNKINPNLQTKIIIHGWISGPTISPWMNEMVEAYRIKQHYNVILGDWSAFSIGEYFHEAHYIVPLVGQYYGSIIFNIKQLGLFNYSDIHIIGHSLGAHIASSIGKELKRLSGESKVKRITGLDAAGPLFSFTDRSHHLSSDDAIFVDGIHTNGYILGYGSSYGTVDFYINGGTAQFGCLLISSYLNNSVLFELNILILCSHDRSHKYWIESINSDKFVGLKCTNYLIYVVGVCNSNDQIVMGENTDFSIPGDYYMNTNLFPPFAKGADF